MSITLIVLLAALMASLIGLKVYFEHRQEKEFEEAKSTGEFAQEEAMAVEQVVETEPKIKEPSIIVVDVENTNSEETVAKPKKKKRYYNNKGRGRKPKGQKQTKTNN